MLLNRLQIKGFRGFEDLKVEDLRQVNLVIGRNNAGKTSLLEAIYLLCAKVGSPFAVLSRGETAPSSILNLFHGRPTIESNAALTIGSDQRQIELSLHRGEVKWRTNDGVDDSFGLYDPNRYGLAALPVFLEARSDPRFSVPAIWKDIALTPKEDDIVNCLQLVLPTLERIAVVEGSLIVRLKDVPTPISMATLGGGVVRLFYLACALILAANNICLIEEIKLRMEFTTRFTKECGNSSTMSPNAITSRYLQQPMDWTACGDLPWLAS